MYVLSDCKRTFTYTTITPYRGKILRAMGDIKEYNTIERTTTERAVLNEEEHIINDDVIIENTTPVVNVIFEDKTESDSEVVIDPSGLFGEQIDNSTDRSEDTPANDNTSIADYKTDKDLNQYDNIETTSRSNIEPDEIDVGFTDDNNEKNTDNTRLPNVSIEIKGKKNPSSGVEEAVAESDSASDDDDDDESETEYDDDPNMEQVIKQLQAIAADKHMADDRAKNFLSWFYAMRSLLNGPREVND